MEELIFDVVAYQVPLEEGLTKRQVQTLLNMLPDLKTMIPLIISENNTTAIGFISETANEKSWEEEHVANRISEIIDDQTKETIDGVYEWEDDPAKENLLVFLGYPEIDELEQWIKETSCPEYIDRLKAALKRTPMSQSEFARRCGCSPSRISALFNRRYRERCPKFIWKNAKLSLSM